MLIVGGGVGGLTARRWLSGLGRRVGVIERSAVLGGCLAASDYPLKWLPGWGEIAGSSYIAKLVADSGAGPLWLQQELTAVGYEGGVWQLHGRGDLRWQARALVLACGAEPYSPYPAHPRLIVGAQREHLLALQGQRVAILGGGDNAIEHALLLHAAGCCVTLHARGALRGNPAMLARLHAAAVPLLTGLGPIAVQADADGVTVCGARYDHAAVFFGYRPSSLLQQWPQLACDGLPDATRQVYWVGDMRAPRFPNVLSTQGDAAVVAKALDAALPPTID